MPLRKFRLQFPEAILQEQKQMIDYKQLWQSVLVEIELAVSKANFTTWFKDTRIVKEDGGVVVLSVPNAFVKEWLLERYHNTILKSLRGLESSIHSVEYVVNKEESRRRDTGATNHTGMNELPIPEVVFKKDDNLNARYTFETFFIGPFN